MPEVSLNWAERLCGCAQWPSPGMRLLPLAGLYRLCAQRTPGDRLDRLVPVVPAWNESLSAAAEKIQQDLDVIELLCQLILENPVCGVVSMVSVLSLEDRMLVPGQGKAAAYMFGDACRLGLSYGVEIHWPDGSVSRHYAFLSWSDAVIACFDIYADGLHPSSPIYMGILELMAPVCCLLQWGHWLAGLLVVGFSDSSNAVKWWHSGYARNDVARMLVMFARAWQMTNETSVYLFHILGHLNDPMDAASREDWERFNAFNCQLEPPFIAEAACAAVHDLHSWLPGAFSSPLPGWKALLDKLQVLKGSTVGAVIDRVPAPEDEHWKIRVRAAADPLLSHPLRIFAPVEELQALSVPAGARVLSFSEATSFQASAARYSMTDGCCGAATWSLAAVSTGRLSTVQIFDRDQAVSRLAEWHTRCANLGHWKHLDYSLLRPCDVLAISTSCKVWSPAGSRRGIQAQDGNDFTKIPKLASALSAVALVTENTPGVLFLSGGKAIEQLKRNCVAEGYELVYRVQLLSWFDTFEARVRFFGVGFTEASHAMEHFRFPLPLHSDPATIPPVGYLLLCSTFVPQKYWMPADLDFMQVKNRYRGPHLIHVLGYIDPSDKLGSPTVPGTVLSLLGAACTQLGSGNTGLYLCLRLRALCLVTMAFCAWAGFSPGCGRVWMRKAMPLEDAVMAGYPLDTPWEGTDDLQYSLINNAVPLQYGVPLLTAVVDALDAAKHIPVDPCSRSSTYFTESCQPVPPMPAPVTAAVVNSFSLSHFSRHMIHRMPGDSQAVQGPAVESDPFAPQMFRSGLRPCRPLYEPRSRESLKNVPLTELDFKVIDLAADFATTYGQSSQVTEDRTGYYAHFAYFCSRLGCSPVLEKGEPVVLKNGQQIQPGLLVLKWLLHEAGAYGIGSSHARNKKLAVRDWHQSQGLEDPTAHCVLLERWLRLYERACGPAVPKEEFGLADIRELAKQLNLSFLRGRKIFACARTMQAYLLRRSEGCSDGKWTVRVRDCRFFDEAGRQLARTARDLSKAVEVELFVRGAKTDQTMRGARRSHFRAERNVDLCVVRLLVEMALEELNAPPDRPLFAWGGGSGTDGVTGGLLTEVLKAVAVVRGKDKARTATHSLRAGGATMLLGANYDPVSLEILGRWSSDTFKRYCRANREQMRGWADKMCDEPVVRVRQLGVEPSDQ